MPQLTVGYFPYRPIDNPYQRLFAGSLESAGCQVLRIPPRKLFPLRHAAAQGVDLLQLDWPHDWYEGRNAWTRALKQPMYRDGLRALRKVPVVWTAHNLRAHDAPDAAFDRRMIQALIDACDGVIVLSEASGALLRSEYRVQARTAVQVVPHGHYTGCYPDTVTQAEARERLGLPEAARVVLSLGRLQPYKGLEELVAAFGQVAAAGNVLLLAGKTVSPEYAERLRAVITEAGRSGVRIEFTDAVVPGDDLQLYFNACDVVALPFRHVLNSGSLLLAMSFGCPVVAPRLGSIPEVACPGAWFGYAAGDPEGLTTAIQTVLRHPDLGGLRPAVLDFTKRSYDWGEVGRKALTPYSSILAPEGAPAGGLARRKR